MSVSFHMHANVKDVWKHVGSDSYTVYNGHICYAKKKKEEHE